ncbi:MAG: hypothetical protein AMJ37_00420 [Dehalococcoidia bacterium DG_18]|nr:MAG: hypothetical protein AMJ37_00420 [Dehalococcoidia bacterium DG_18]
MNVEIGTIIPLAACVVYIVLIAMAARQSRGKRVNQLFIWYAFLLMMWSFGSFMLHAYPSGTDLLLWDRLLVVCAVFASVAQFQFVRVFLGKSQPRLWLSLSYGLCALFAVLTITGYTVKSAYYVDGTFHQEMGFAMWAAAPIAFAFSGAAIFYLVQGYRGERDPFARNRIAYPLAGISIAMVLGLSNVVPEWRWYPIDHSGNLINAALLSYAILRYRLLDIGVVFRSTLRYSLQTLVLAGIFLLLGVASLAASEALDVMNWGVAIVIVLVIAITLPPLFRLVRGSMGGMFAGEHSDYRHVLKSTSRAMSDMPDLEKQAIWLIGNLMRTMDVGKGGLFLLDEEEKRYLPRAMRGYDDQAVSQMHLESDNPAVAYLARADRCLTAGDLERVPQLRAMWKLEREQLAELETGVLVPVKVKDNLIGVILLGPKRSRKMYSVDELEFIYTVANQAGVAIENTRLYQETKDRAEWMDMVNRLTRAIGLSLDMTDVYDTFSAALRNLVDFDRISIALPEGDNLRFLAVSSEVPTELGAGVTIPLKKSVAAWVIENRSTNVENDFAQERQFPVDETHLRDGLRSAIRVPLFYKGEVFGTLNLTSRHTNSYADKKQRILLEQIAGQVAVAIKNALLYEEAKLACEEAKRAYEELNVAQEYMVRSEKLRALGEMAGGVAHDFNNVLSVILGRAQLALDSAEDPRLKKSLLAIEQAALDAAKTVRRLQEFTRVRTDTDFDQVDVSHLVQSALHMAEPRLRESMEKDGVNIEVSVDLNTVNSVWGDTTELREALLNIIFNAVDAMPEGGKLTIKARQEDNQVVLSLADTGVGIPDKMLANIFDPFFTTKGPDGMGLGLSITYGIINRHGGNVDVESNLGNGSTFYIRLPLGGEVMKNKSSSDSPSSPRKAKILLVDDDPEVSEVLELMLDQIGSEVTVVSQGQEAITRFEQGEYDLVITDLGMPDISGWEVAKAVKQKSPGTPVVLITGWGVQLDSEQRNKSGVDGVIAKPFSKQVLTDEMARLLKDVK